MTVTRNRKVAKRATKTQGRPSAKSIQVSDGVTSRHGGGTPRPSRRKPAATLAADARAHTRPGSRKGPRGTRSGATSLIEPIPVTGVGLNRDLRGGLAGERLRSTVERTMRQIAELLSEPTRQAQTVSKAAFERRAQVAVDTLRVITLGGSRQLQSLIEALEPVTPKDPDAVDEAEAQARGRLRLQALYQKIVADSYTVADIGEQWGVSRQRLAQLRNEDRLFAISVPYHRGLLYPRWQFGPDQRPRPIMANLIQEARNSGLDAIDFHQLMNNPASGAGTPPVEMLDHGHEELVLGIIRATDA